MYVNDVVFACYVKVKIIIMLLWHSQFYFTSKIMVNIRLWLRWN